MPTATPFIVLGMGDGFSFNQCRSKFNVNDPYGDGQAFTDYVALTLAGAMQLYWNLYSVSGSAFYDDGAGGFDDTSVDGSVELSNEPSVRVCDTSQSAILEDVGSGGSSTSSLSIQYSSGIYRLYDGDTSDEDNFLGYGVSYVAGARAGDFITGAEEYYASFYVDDPFIDWETYTAEEISFGVVDLLKIKATSGGGVGTGYDATLNDDLDFYTY
jgi:hypothetical protein